MKRASIMTLCVLFVGAGTAAAQSTGMPSFNAPYRAFGSHEFGGTLSFPEGGATGIEGQYKFGYRTWDVGLRGGILDVDAPADDVVLLGATGRVRVLTHSQDFPFDGAFILGAGTQDFDNLIMPIGLSLGRRVNIENSSVSIVPYGQPTLFLVFDNNDLNDTVNFALGLGVDVRFGSSFDLRASFGIGDVEGFAVSVVWVR
ncbi:MAG: hypothetical protein OEO17_16470 [Gemmatimonadota bacterium]|nr:hypothetical protein [Gemmatimonadota bacterium]